MLIKELKENRESALTKYSDSYNTYVQYKNNISSDEQKLLKYNQQKKSIDDTLADILSKINTI